MTALARDEFMSLVSWEKGPCVSIYIETDRSGPEQRRNAIRLRNALRDARKLLAERSVSDSLSEKILSTLESRQEDKDLLQHLDRGMAIFLAPGYSKRILAADPFVDRIEVGDVFYIRPLLTLLANDRQFLVLALDREDVRLYRGDGCGLREWTADLPESWDKIRGMTDYEKQTGFHPSGPTPTTDGTPTPKFHSYGESPDDLRKVQTDQFAQAVAKAVEDACADETGTPLVLCAGPELAGMFRQHYKGNGLLEAFIDANPAGLDEAEMYERACALVEPAMRAVREEAAERFAVLNGNRDSRASVDATDVVPAAAQGRVDTLFIARDANLLGRFDPAGQDAAVHPEPATGDVDLANLAARETLRHGGTVLVPSAENMPADAPIAVIFRY